MRKLIVALLVAALCMVGLAGAVELDNLPANTMVMIDGDYLVGGSYHPGEIGGTYFDVYLEEDGKCLPETVYPGWCVQTGIAAITDTPYCARLSSTTGEPCASLFCTTREESCWNRVNWIINHKGDANWKEVQYAIWRIVGDEDDIPWGFSPWNTAVSQSLFDRAMSSGSYIPGCGEYEAVLIEPCEVVGQNVIIEVPVPGSPSPVPEFPTMMIPVFLVGSVLVGASVLKKE